MDLDDVPARFLSVSQNAQLQTASSLRPGAKVVYTVCQAGKSPGEIASERLNQDIEMALRISTYRLNATTGFRLWNHLTE